MSDGHWPPDVTVSRCRPQRWHQESPTMALNLKEDPVVMAPGNAISFWNILFFSDCSFPAYWKFQEQWALSAGNHLPWCQEIQHSQSREDNQSSHGLYKAAWLCVPFGPRFFFFLLSAPWRQSEEVTGFALSGVTTLEKYFPFSAVTYFFG